jgi:hypothetical protein
MHTVIKTSEGLQSTLSIEVLPVMEETPQWKKVVIACEDKGVAIHVFDDEISELITALQQAQKEMNV